MADIRASVHDWYGNVVEPANIPHASKRNLAFEILQGDYGEDKLAGILLIQEILVPANLINCQRDVPLFAKLFSNGYIYEWNTCDWFVSKS